MLLWALPLNEMEPPGPEKLPLASVGIRMGVPVFKTTWGGVSDAVKTSKDKSTLK